MDKKINIRIFHHLLLLILAMNTLFFAVGSQQVQLNTFEEEKAEKSVATAENNEDDDPSTEKVYLIAYEAIVPILQIQFDQQHYFTFELPLLEENEFFTIAEKPLFVSSYFTTLFCHIISPNAP